MPETLGKSLQEIDVVWDAKMASARSLLRRLSPSVIHHGAQARPLTGSAGAPAVNIPDSDEVEIELQTLGVADHTVKTT